MVSIWRKLWCLFAVKNIKFILQIFLELLQRYCKLVILDTLGMPGYAHLVENLCVYLYTKNQLHPSCFSGDIAKICNFDVLSISGCAHPKW